MHFFRLILWIYLQGPDGEHSNSMYTYQRDLRFAFLPRVGEEIEIPDPTTGVAFFKVDRVVHEPMSSDSFRGHIIASSVDAYSQKDEETIAFIKALEDSGWSDVE